MLWSEPKRVVECALMKGEEDERGQNVEGMVMAKVAAILGELTIPDKMMR